MISMLQTVDIEKKLSSVGDISWDIAMGILQRSWLKVKSQTFLRQTQKMKPVIQNFTNSFIPVSQSLTISRFAKPAHSGIFPVYKRALYGHVWQIKK
jgi:hypothetical protein